MRALLITSGLNVVSKEILKFSGIVGVVESTPLTNNYKMNLDLKNYLKKILKVTKSKNELKFLADKMNIDYFSLDRENTDLFFNWVKNLNPDLLIVYSMSQLIESRVINLCKFGGINLHPSLLPDYKGPNPMQWAFLRNESNFGYTLHFIDPGEDSGRIISQCGFEIPRGSLISEFEQYAAMKYGFPLIKKAYIELVRNKYLASNPQPRKARTFRAKRLTIFEIYNEIDWENWQVERIWYCLRGIPEVSRLIPVKHRIIRNRNWRIGNYSRTALNDNTNHPYIKFDRAGFAIYIPDGRIEVNFKSKILQACTQFIIKFYR
jgi:methionyl-tRNA formyltransferase